MPPADPAPPPPTGERLSDEVLLGRARAGSHEAFAELVHRYERELFGYLRRYLGDDDLAADVFQNTFTQVWVKIGQYEPGRPGRPWLYAVATNQAIDALRRRRRRRDSRAEPLLPDDGEGGGPRPLFDLLEDRAPGPPERAEGAESREQVRRAVDKLPDGLRPVVALAYFQGLKYQEIADILGIPLGTVKSRLHAALARLAAEWPAVEEGNEQVSR